MYINKNGNSYDLMQHDITISNNGIILKTSNIFLSFKKVTNYKLQCNFKTIIACVFKISIYLKFIVVLQDGL